ncbi:MAG: hypothetical protein H0W89_07680 [Candidatus Levybacteria bacterium]|nr:hypothetical protein [Candidatus Levybacteria bacterium]
MLIIFLSLIIGFIILIVIEVFLATLGENEVYKNPERSPRTFGTNGPTIKYLIMGDSTSAGQGTTYDTSFAVKTAEHLAETYKVTMINSGISGAKIREVLDDQVPFAEEFKADVVIFSMSANDVVRLTSTEKIKSGLTETLDRVIAANCNAKIVVTGSPDMGTILRFYPPLNWIASWHSKNVTEAMKPIIAERGLTYAPIYEEVGPPFRKDHTLFYKDKYHANERGHVVWTNVLNKALDEALINQPSHCKS